ncbi:hypothetical protein ACWG0P_14070 [Amedibacillus sp. YH-ame6]
MAIYNNTPEERATIGSGSGLYGLDEALAKYKLLLPLIKVPFIKQTTNEVEIKVACSDTITKVNGVTSLESSEADIYLHRDVLRILEKLNGKTLPLIAKTGEHVGYKYNGTITYTPSDAEMDAAWQGTVKITPVSKPEYIDNCLPLLVRTVKFVSPVPSMVELNETTGTYVTTISLSEVGANATVKSCDTAIATATIADNKLTVTGVKEGSTIIEITSVLEGFASWTTTIHVTVPPTIVKSFSAPIEDAEPKARTVSK